MSQSASLDPKAFRQTLGTFVTGVTVITTRDADGTRHGLTANSFNSVSLDPPLILWSLRREARSFEVFDRAERFTVHILAEDQVELSNRFARPSEDRFAGLAVSEGIGGVPVIQGCAAHLECRKEAAYPGGDHVVFLGRVEAIQNTGRRPLAFGAGRYMVVHPHGPGPAVEEAERDAAAATLRATTLARPAVEELAAATGHPTALVVWGTAGPTVVWWGEPPRAHGLRLRPGMVVPLLGSASGLVFAAFLPAARTEDLMRKELADARAPDTPAGASAGWVRDRLEQVRRDGWASSLEQESAGERHLAAFAAPILNKEGALVAALSMVDDAAGLAPDDAAVAQMRDAAEGLSHRLGFTARSA